MKDKEKKHKELIEKQTVDSKFCVGIVSFLRVDKSLDHGRGKIWMSLDAKRRNCHLLLYLRSVPRKIFSDGLDDFWCPKQLRML